jgi:protein-tyrosine-phosphatase
MADRADVIIAFDAMNMISLRQRYRHLAAPVLWLSDFGEQGFGPRAIADPEGSDVETFRSVYRRIDSACERIAALIKANLRDL